MVRWCWAAGLLFAGCSGGDVDPDKVSGPETSEPNEPDPSGPVWYGEVEGLMREHCVACHQTGGIGPFTLDEYAVAAQWADASALAVQQRTMPPWLATSDGSCQQFSPSRWLDDTTIQQIVGWAAAGAPEGDVALAVSEPPPAPPQLDRIDVTLSTPVFEPVPEGTPEALRDEYRCFLLDDEAIGGGFVTGYEVVPGNEAIVHHALAMQVDPDALGYDGVPNSVHLAELDGADGRTGWDCYVGVGGNVTEKGVPISWAPGSGAVHFDDGYGLAMGERDVFVVQIHYNFDQPGTEGQTDSTELRLRKASEAEVARPIYVSLPDLFLGSMLAGTPEQIPPGEPAYAFPSTLPVWQLMSLSGAPADTWFQPAELMAAGPHMHELGSEFHIRRHGVDHPDECLIEVLDWDFHWQMFYFYEQPILLQPDDEIEFTCVWDSSGETEPTWPGWGTSNEMCLPTLMLSPAP
jgi:hypothetical protein